MAADLDVVEAHVSIKAYSSRQPYITADGRTSLDMPYESCEWIDVCYEPKVSEISTAKVTFPSLIAFPELRPLLQMIKEGDRVEIFNFQPDCGDPVIAGFIPPNGITEQDGKLILDVEDTMGQLRWQHLHKYEYLIGNASQLYNRGRSLWQDIITEDFLGPNPAADYDLTTQGAASTVTFGPGFVKVAGTGGNIVMAPHYLPNGTTINPGDTWLIEADCTLNSLFPSGSPGFKLVECAVGLRRLPVASTAEIVAFLIYQNSGVAGYTYEQWPGLFMQTPAGATYGLNTVTGGTNQATAITMPQSRHLAVFIHFDETSNTASAYAYLDQILVDFSTQVWTPDTAGYAPMLFFSSFSATETVTVTSWRASRLSPALLRAGRFNPQTTDPLTYQPNNEDNLQFLQLIAEKDNAEYRPIYHSWPTNDELELDAVGVLGKFASRTLSYEQPPALPTEGSPQISPRPVIQDAATYLVAPPFRFEEGYNLEAPPKVNAKANAHSNDIIRVGSSSIDSQVFAEKWSAAELGRPQHSPSGLQYPRFELISNDDRIGIQSLNSALAGYELTRRIDTTPSLEVTYVDELPFAFKWRAGDQVFTKTQSLRFNVEQELRAQKIAYKAGSPVRTVTLGKTDWDPTMLRQISESMKISWLYEQSGTNPGTYVYPTLGNIATGVTSAAFTFPLDQYTTGSALVYAAVHWFADANVMNIQPILNGVAIDLTAISGASGTDSGLIIVTNSFQAPGVYTLQFRNNDALTRNLTAAYLVLRLKA